MFGNLPETTLSVYATQKSELWELDLGFVGRLLDADDLLARKFFRYVLEATIRSISESPGVHF